MKRVVGLDFGLKRIGWAISDPLKIFAQPIGKIFAGKSPELSAEIVWNEIKAYVQSKKLDISLFVIGFPLTLKGVEKERATEVRRFSAALFTLSNIPVHHIDERLSSLQAEKSLQHLSMNRKERAQHVDEVSASILLQCYLDQPRSPHESSSISPNACS